MKQNYLTRAMKARDPRFAKIAAALGYGTREMRAAPVDVEETARPAPEPRRVAPEALDHDEDGRKGGSKAGKASTRTRGATKAEMAAEYERLTGEKPDGRWNRDTLEQELGKARGRQ